jgi:predicted ester cyclase
MSSPLCACPPIVKCKGTTIWREPCCVVARLWLVAHIACAYYALKTASGGDNYELHFASRPKRLPTKQPRRATKKRGIEEVIRQNHAALNRGDINRYVQDWAEDAKTFDQPFGREGIRRAVADILATFPDWRFDIVELVAKGDTVVVRLTASGTHRGVGKLPLNGGMLVGVEPTLKHFSMQHIHWYKLRDGKIIESTATRNDIGMMRQLGLLPPTGLPK